MTIKIIGGEFKGRLLKVPKGGQTRPTTSLVRKAVFDILQPNISDAVFLDLFSGSGAMGIEALSRGAKQSIFVETDYRAIQCIKENLALLKLTSQTIVWHLDIFKALIKLQKKQTLCDIIYADPPYDRSKIYLNLLINLDKNQILAPQGILMIESRIPSPLERLVTPLERLQPILPRRYGTTQIEQYIVKLR